MKKKILALALGTLPLTLSVPVQAQQTKQVARIGYLSSGTAASESTRSKAIRLALRELGYIEGQNIAIEFRYGHGKLDRAAELVSELARLNIDLIVITAGERWVRAAKNATKAIPIVMTGTGGDAVKEGLVKSLARPGGNITGISLLSRELGGKRLELLKEAVSKLTRVAVIYDPAAPGDFERVFAAIKKERPDGLYVPVGPLTRIHAKRIGDFALKSRLPSVYSRPEFMEAGGLMSYDADVADNYRRVAYYVDRILKGANPADLPVEQPTKFELVINLKAAKQIGLAIPESMLFRADKVIK